MRLIFIYGLPATGKLTVAQELAKRTGYRLFHNHLVVDLLLSTFEFGSEPFVRLREEMWLTVFREAGRSGLEGMIFTFNPERTVRAGFAERVVEVVEAGGGTVEFVELVCPVKELKARMGNASRVAYRKLSSVELFEWLEAAGEFDTGSMPRAKVRVDTGAVGAEEAGRRIGKALGI